MWAAGFVAMAAVATAGTVVVRAVKQSMTQGPNQRTEPLTEAFEE
jgi:hypothetical protein